MTDQGGDGRHVRRVAAPRAALRSRDAAEYGRSIDVVAAAFEGKSAVDRQRMVYKGSCDCLLRSRLLSPRFLSFLSAAIWMELQETVHAVDSMTTKTPAEVAK